MSAQLKTVSIPIKARLLVNKAELAEANDVSPQTVDAWIRRGIPYVQRGGRGTQWVFNLLECARWRWGSTEESEDDPEKMPAKDRLDWYRGARERTKHLQECGELLPAADYERELSSAFKAIAVTLESLGDVLERDCGIPPDAVERVNAVCDRERDAMYQRITQGS